MSCHDDHHHDHNHGHDELDHVLPIPTNESQSLRQQINFNNLTGLNLHQENSEIYKIFDKYDSTKFQITDYISSDADETLILNIPFISSCKIYSIILRTSGLEGKCPKTIKVFKNDDQIDFDNVEDLEPTFVLNHPQIGVIDEEANTNLDSFVEHYLPRHQFAGTTQLTLYVQDIYEGNDEEATIYSVEIRGEFKKITKDPIITMYESAANPADHKTGISELTKNLHSI